MARFAFSRRVHATGIVRSEDVAVAVGFDAAKGADGEAVAGEEVAGLLVEFYEAGGDVAVEVEGEDLLVFGDFVAQAEDELGLEVVVFYGLGVEFFLAP